MPESEAIDISHWNRITDWDAVPEFRMWCMKATEGKGFRSNVFNSRWVKLRELGVEMRGAYHWIRSDSSVLDQFKNLRRAINDHGGLQRGEFVMLDWETTPGIKNVTVAMVNQWIKLVEKEWPGRHIVYASDWVPGFKTWRNENPDYPLWYANYNTGPSSRGGAAETDEYGADVWQWTSTALVPGFQKGIDMNDVLDWETMESISGLLDSPDPEPEAKPDLSPPASAPSKWGLFPLDKNKPYLVRRPPRMETHKVHVKYLQRVLGLTADGWFGPATEFKVKQVQKYVRIHIDGEVGPQTWPVVDYIALQSA